MPAYDRPMVIHSPGPDMTPSKHTAVGAVIKFRSNDLARIQAFLNTLEERGIIEPALAVGYNDALGAPVWYIP